MLSKTLIFTLAKTRNIVSNIVSKSVSNDIKPIIKYLFAVSQAS